MARKSYKNKGSRLMMAKPIIMVMSRIIRKFPYRFFWASIECHYLEAQSIQFMQR